MCDYSNNLTHEEEAHLYKYYDTAKKPIVEDIIPVNQPESTEITFPSGKKVRAYEDKSFVYVQEINIEAYDADVFLSAKPVFKTIEENRKKIRKLKETNLSLLSILSRNIHPFKTGDVIINQSEPFHGKLARVKSVGFALKENDNPYWWIKVDILKKDRSVQTSIKIDEWRWKGNLPRWSNVMKKRNTP